MKKIIFIRHGETDYNLNKRYCGLSNPPLNQKGRQQLEETAVKLADVPIVRIYTSNLTRAIESAQIIAGSLIPIEQLSGLNEINFGAFEGLNFQQINEQYPDIYKAWIDNPLTTHPPQGESLEEMAARAQKAFDFILTQDTKGTIAIVTHQGLLKVILCKIQDFGLDKFWEITFANGEYRTIEL